MVEDIIRKYGERVGYADAEIETFHEGGHRMLALNVWDMEKSY